MNDRQQSERAPAARRWPVQVYLDKEEIALLDRAAAALGTTKSDIVRLAVRRQARELLPPEDDPAWRLVGLAEAESGLPADLAGEHDAYLSEWQRGGGG